MNTQFLKEVTDICNQLECDDDGNRWDYSLSQVAQLCNATVVNDTLQRDGMVIPMDGSLWVEMGHQYSLYKQWCPLHNPEPHI